MDSNFDIKQLQKKQFAILKELKCICDKHNIKYFLTDGTLVGAVRHKGFIPWDDDIDVGMTYGNLMNFGEVCKTELPPLFFCRIA